MFRSGSPTAPDYVAAVYQDFFKKASKNLGRRCGCSGHRVGGLWLGRGDWGRRFFASLRMTGGAEGTEGGGRTEGRDRRGKVDKGGWKGQAFWNVAAHLMRRGLRTGRRGKRRGGTRNGQDGFPLETCGNDRRAGGTGGGGRTGALQEDKYAVGGQVYGGKDRWGLRTEGDGASRNVAAHLMRRGLRTGRRGKRRGGTRNG